jgi:chemotaxis signal transduction protein
MADDLGHLTFEVGTTTCAVAVDAVMEVLRVEEAQLLPGAGRTPDGELVLADVRGACYPVLDLRRDGGAGGEGGDLVVPRYADQAGLLVDRVLSVERAGALQASATPGSVLPAYARGVLRATGGGPAVLLVELPPVPGRHP